MFLKDQPLIKFKSHLYYEEKDEHAENLKKLTKIAQEIYVLTNVPKY